MVIIRVPSGWWMVVAGVGNTKWDEAKLMVPGRETICQG